MTVSELTGIESGMTKEATGLTDTLEHPYALTRPGNLLTGGVPIASVIGALDHKSRMNDILKNRFGGDKKALKEATSWLFRHPYLADMLFSVPTLGLGTIPVTAMHNKAVDKSIKGIRRATNPIEGSKALLTAMVEKIKDLGK